MNNDWHNEIIYQIYPKSFLDTSNTGYGDLHGIITKIPYLENLGITMIWISPVFESPMKDNGYDISDYYKIDSIFGTNEDMYQLINEAKKYNIKIMLDLVVNHTSDQHHWFQEAKKSVSNEYRDYYIWRDKPNDIDSIFLGKAWEKDETTGQYYFHLFAKEQPDLNWNNKQVREKIYKMMNFWIDKGVAGFRMDVIEFLGKDVDNQITSDGENLHKYIYEMNQNTFGRRGCITVGESWSATDETEKLYTLPSRNELSMIFRFDHITTFWDRNLGKWNVRDFDLIEFKKIIFKRQMRNPLESWNTLFWGSHDLPRSVSHYIKTPFEQAGAKMLFTISSFMSGTPFIYQGEEIGMTNLTLAENDYKDIEAKNALTMLIRSGYSKEEALKKVNLMARDNARTPIQWNGDKHAGFSKVKPWILVNPNYVNINVSQQTQDKNSVLNFYKKIIKIRKDEKYSKTILYGKFKPLNESDNQLFSYEKQGELSKLLIIANFSSNQKTIEDMSLDGEILINNYNTLNRSVMLPYQVIVLEVNSK